MDDQTFNQLHGVCIRGIGYSRNGESWKLVCPGIITHRDYLCQEAKSSIRQDTSCYLEIKCCRLVAVWSISV